MKRSSRSATPFASRNLLLLAFPFVAIGIAWYLLVPSQVTPEVDLAAEASAKLQQGDIEGAYLIIQELHETSSEPDVLYLLAVTENMRGNNRRAIEVLSQIPRFESDAGLLTMAGQYALAIPRLSVARDMLEKSLVVSPDNEETIRMLSGLEGNLSNARRVRQLIIDLDGIDKCNAQDVFLFCSGARATYDLYENIGRLEPAYQNDPQMGELVYALTSNFLAMNRLDAARDLLDRAHKNPPTTDLWMVHQAALELALIQNETDEASRHLIAIGDEGQLFPRYWIALGRVLRQRDAPLPAIEAYRNAADLDPFDAEPLFALSRLLSDTSPDEAADLARRTRQLQQLNTQVESVVTLDSLEEAVERFPSIVGKLVDVKAYREAEICLQWLKSEGYRSHEATSIEERMGQSADIRPSRLQAPKVSGLRAVDLSSLTQAVPKPSGEVPQLQFEDVTTELSVGFEYMFPALADPTILMSLGAGVAAFDFDSDGQVDLFFPQAGEFPAAENRLADQDTLLRRGTNGYADVSRVAGIGPSDYGHGVTTGDVNSDGLPDLFVTNYGTNQLLINNGDGTFCDASATAGFTDVNWSVSSVARDFDKDGDLDLFITNYLQQETCKDGVQGSDPCGPIHIPAVQDQCYSSNGDGTFEKITATSGIVVPDGKGLGVVARDFDRDGLVDLFVGNDTTHNRLFYNRSTRGDVVFHESSVQSGVAVGNDGDSEASMGIASDDVDNNGFPDLFVTNFEQQTNSWYTNVDGNAFVNDTERLGLARSSYSTMGWGTQFVDLDDDRRLDLVVLNGRLHEGAMRPQLYRFGGVAFESFSTPSDDYFSQQWHGRGLAVADLNRDARPDLIATHRTGPPKLLVSRSGSQKRLCIGLVARTSHREGLGTRLTIASGESSVTRTLHGGGGYLVANQKKLWFVAPKNDSTASLTIDWPSGRTQQLTNVTPTAFMTIVETEGESPRLLMDAE